jgi:hypothetical protein
VRRAARHVDMEDAPQGAAVAPAIEAEAGDGGRRVFRRRSVGRVLYIVHSCTSCFAEPQTGVKV